MRVVVVGSGAWGTAFGGVLRARDHDVFMAGRATLDAAPYDEADWSASATCHAAKLLLPM